MGLIAERIFPAGALLGEGPVWDPRIAAWWWVDVEGHVLHCFDGTSDRAWLMPTYVSMIALRAAGGIAVALRDEVRVFDGVLGEVIARIDHPGCRFNDGAVDPRGRLWLGSLALDFHTGGGALYRLDSDRFSCQIPDVTISNGIRWSADGRTCYYIDTPTGRVDAFDFDLESGVLSQRRPCVLIPPERGSPDGMAIDAEGLLWIGLWGGGAVLRVDPRSGRIVDEVAVPGAINVTACAFAGERLLITTVGDLYVVEAGVVGVAPAYLD